MYMCSCNPFTDGDVKEFLDEKDGKTSMCEVYTACSGGEKPQCCTCLPRLKEVVRGHNANVTVEELQKQIATTKKKKDSSPVS